MDADPYVENGRRCVPAAGHIGPALRTPRTAPLRWGRVRHRTPLRHKAAVLHPLTGWGLRPSALPGVAPSADGALDDWGFRWLRPAGFRAVRGAGVSPVATGGSFARCGGRPGALPPGPLRFFEKNRVKLLFLGASGKKRTRCRSSASLFIQFTASWNSPATAGQPEHG